jgi:diamine N-acetyltransferase
MIFGERIRFRGVERDDLPHFMKWINDPEILQGIGVYLPMSMVDEQDWFDKMRSRPPEEHNLAIEVKELTSEDKETWTLIGSCGFFNFDKRNACAEFGIMIGEKAYWNRGLGSESVRLLADYGFHTLNLNRIYLRVLETNPRAIRAYENAGFSHEGRQRQADFRDGKYIDLLVMSLLVGEY